MGEAKPARGGQARGAAEPMFIWLKLNRKKEDEIIMLRLRGSKKVSYEGSVEVGLRQLGYRRARLVAPKQIADEVRTKSPELGQRVASPEEIARELVCQRAGLLSAFAHPTIIEADVVQDKSVVSATGGLEKGLFDEVSPARDKYLQLLTGSNVEDARTRETDFGQLLEKQTSSANLSPNEQIALDYANAIINAIAAKWQGQGWVVRDADLMSNSHFLIAGKELSDCFWEDFRGKWSSGFPKGEIAVGLAVLAAGAFSIFEWLTLIVVPFCTGSHQSFDLCTVGTSTGAGILGGVFIGGGGALAVKGIRGALVDYRYMANHRSHFDQVDRIMADVKAAVAEVEKAVKEATQELSADKPL